jgi:iron complex transport system substrate-binding protein
VTRSYDAGVRVVSLLPSATEIVFSLGRGDDLVGVTFECDHPPEARSRRVVSTSSLPEGLPPAEIDAAVSARLAAGEDLYHLDEQALAELDADVILTQDLCAVCAVDLERVDDALAYLGCSAKVVTLDPSSLDEVIESILLVGDVLQVRGDAEALVGALRQRLATLKRAVADAPSREVMVLEWTDPPFSAGHWVPDLVVAGGGAPLLADPGKNSVRIEWSAVRAAPADVVVVAPCGYHLDAAVDLARDLVDAGRLPRGAEVWAVDADSHFVRPGPRLVDGAEVMGRILHPDRMGSPAADHARRVSPGRPAW